MITQYDPRLNILTNNVAASDGSALCAIAMGEHLGLLKMGPGSVRRILRRWRRRNIVTDRLTLAGHSAAHQDLGLTLLPLGVSHPRWRLQPGEVAYAYFANATETAIHCVLMDAEGEVIYDPLGSSSHARGGWLVGLRIFRPPA